MLTLAGVPIGQPQRVYYDWTTELAAGASRSPAVGTSGTVARALVTPAVGPLFVAFERDVTNTTPDSPLVMMMDSGRGSFVVVPTAGVYHLQIQLINDTSAVLSAPQNHDDLVGATGFSTLRLRFVPEPGCIAMLAPVLWMAMRRRG